ncbi:MAG TPA: sugar phosphate isomerase/epimerase family protein [Pirellulaceae bacterium]|nr:sugar phosphate isomerase/epimerase family protein [Pirellulaceae bacterium]
MLEIKVGIQLASLRMPLKQGLLTAARLGASAVEIDARGEVKPQDLTRSAVRQVRKMLDDLNLRVCAVGFRTQRGYDAAENLEHRIDATKAAMKMAFDLGASVVVNAIGRVPEGTDSPGWRALLESLSDIGRYGQHVGATLAAETGTESGPELKRLIDALPPGALGVNFDPGNLIVNGHSVTEAIRALGPHVVHVHAKDGVRDLSQGRGVEVPLGRGSVEFPELLGVLEEQQYRGYFTIEREASADPVYEIGEAVKFLKNI